MSGSAPHFAPPINRLVLRFPDQEQCALHSLDESICFTHEDEAVIAAICNGTLIYNRLFRKRLNDQPYTITDAQNFLRWAQEGWKSRSWFVFLLRDSKHRIIGAVDIKSAQTDEAEIGYWASATSPGIMANAVIQLCEVAKEAGYRRLIALIAPDNERSIYVAQRAEFVQVEDMTRDGTRYLQFTRNIL